MPLFSKMDKNERATNISSFFVFVARKKLSFVVFFNFCPKNQAFLKKVILLENALIFKKKYIILLLRNFFCWILF
uniref:Uncharacterized protein n=1 Tax=viral metagenome TaxID=1070528 RepID=A0A6C0BTE2_9ZZZZ